MWYAEILKKHCIFCDAIKIRPGDCPTIQEPTAKPSDRFIFPYVFDK